MGKNKQDKRGTSPVAAKHNAGAQAKAPAQPSIPLSERIGRIAHRVPAWAVFAVVVFLWATFYYGPVLQTSREYSFWSTDSRTLHFFMQQPHAWLRYVGRAALLYSYRWAVVGGALMTLLLAGGSALLGYCLRTRRMGRVADMAVGIVQFVPALAYMAVLTYYGLDFFFEAETGYILGIPMVVCAALLCVALVRWALTRRQTAAAESTPALPDHRSYLAQLGVVLLVVAALIGFDQTQRPYVRTISRIILCEQEQDWQGIQDIARANAQQSNRIMAAFYAASLVHTGQVGSRVYDIRLEYDTIQLHGMDGRLNNGINMYLQEGNYHAGLAETSYHACMEEMVMTGPTLRLLKLMTKCALLMNEPLLARKYLRLLRDVPGQGAFCQKYAAMTRNAALIDADAEMAMLRKLEPVEDSFENQHQNPTFMGYNLTVNQYYNQRFMMFAQQGFDMKTANELALKNTVRSLDAMVNSTAVCLYTKLMPQFCVGLQPLVGTQLPDNFADGAVVGSRQNEQLRAELFRSFPALQMRVGMVNSYLESMRPYMDNREAHGAELFPEQKGAYLHYYLFGNLRATKAGYTGESLMRGGGVN